MDTFASAHRAKIDTFIKYFSAESPESMRDMLLLKG